MPKKPPPRAVPVAGAGRKTSRAAPEVFGADYGDLSSASGVAAAAATLSPALRLTLEHLAATAFARIGFAPDEASRLRSDVRQLRRQVEIQARQIQQLYVNQTAALDKRAKSPSADAGRAARAVQEWQTHLANEPVVHPDASEAARRQWVHDGLLVPTADLARTWGVTRQALDQARERGDLVGLKVANRQYCPAAFLELKAEDVASICRSLVDVDPVSRIIFWLRPHPDLNDQTLAQAIQVEGLTTAQQAAEAFADEQAGVPRIPADQAASARAA